MSTNSYPTHSTVNYATSSGARQALFQSKFTSSEGNFAWKEWGIWNDPVSSDVNGDFDTGIMLNRKVQALGTKTSAAVWTFTATLSLS
jgi:hypothetical protein